MENNDKELDVFRASDGYLYVLLIDYLALKVDYLALKDDYLALKFEFDKLKVFYKKRRMKKNELYV